jgi:hypothetical protein
VGSNSHCIKQANKETSAWPLHDHKAIPYLTANTLSTEQTAAVNQPTLWNHQSTHLHAPGSVHQHHVPPITLSNLDGLGSNLCRVLLIAALIQGNLQRVYKQVKSSSSSSSSSILTNACLSCAAKA